MDGDIFNFRMLLRPRTVFCCSLFEPHFHTSNHLAGFDFIFNRVSERKNIKDYEAKNGFKC